MKDINDKLLETLAQVQSLGDATSKTMQEITDGDESEMLEELQGEMPSFELSEKETKIEDEDSSDIQTDYARSRNFTYALQEISLTMLKNVCSIAVATQHPRAYDTFNALLTNMRGLNKDLMDINRAAAETRAKTRTLPPPIPKEEPGHGDGLSVEVKDADGNVVRVSTQPRPTSKNILEVIRQAKEKKQELDTSEIADRARELDRLEQERLNAVEAEFSEVENQEDGDTTTQED
jgi:hypothetical protein